MQPTAMKPVLVTPPADVPVTLAEAKAHLRVEHAEDDAFITAKVAAAVAHLDGLSGVLGRCLMTQTWRFDFDGFPDDRALRLVFPDIVRTGDDVPVVTYRDLAGAVQTLDAAAYHAIEDARGSALRLASGASWPETSDHPAAVSVTASFGYADAASVPGPLKAAVLEMVGDLYRFRETAVIGVTAAAIPMSADVERMIRPYRRGLVS